MGTVTVLANPMDASDAQRYSHSGPFIDFLLERFPEGFSAPHTTLLNLNRLKVEDYDTEVGEHDDVVLTLAPGVPLAAFAAFGAFATAAYMVTNAVIMFALQYALNKYFGPKGTKPDEAGVIGGSTPSASPTYSLNAPSNVARLGSPIPVQYGRVLAVPDIASQPYSWYKDNQMYVGMMLCIGQEEYVIHDTQIAGTPVASLGSDVASMWHFPPSVHQKSFGVIQNTTGVYENVYTSPAVSDQEMIASAGASFESTGWQRTQDYSPDARGNYSVFWVDRDATEYATALANGRGVFLIIDDGPNKGVYQVTYMTHAGSQGKYADGLRNHQGHIGVPWNGPSNSNMKLSYTAEAFVGAVVGPISANPQETLTSLLQYDIVFPGGVFTYNPDGSLGAFTVGATFVAEPIDDDDQVIGAPFSYVYQETFATNTAQRRTLYHNVPPGRYRVKGSRTTPISDRASDQSAMYWKGLKSVLGNTFGGEVYGNTTLVMMRIKATEGLATDAIDRIAIDCTRVLNGVATRSPIEAFVDVLTNQRYGGRLPMSALDGVTLDALSAEWGDGQSFDAVFDTSTTVWEAASATTRIQHAAPALLGSVVTLIQDRDHTTADMEFSEEMNNIKDGSVSLTYMFATYDEPDGVEVAYRNQSDGSQRYVVYPPTAVDPEQIDLKGCRDRIAALAYATQRWKQLRLRRRLISFDTELDAHVVPVGSPIYVKHRLLGMQRVLYVVNSVTPKGEFLSTIAAHRHESGVFS